MCDRQDCWCACLFTLACLKAGRRASADSSACPAPCLLVAAMQSVSPVCTSADDVCARRREHVQRECSAATGHSDAACGACVHTCPNCHCRRCNKRRVSAALRERCDLSPRMTRCGRRRSRRPPSWPTRTASSARCRRATPRRRAERGRPARCTCCLLSMAAWHRAACWSVSSQLLKSAGAARLQSSELADLGFS